MTRQRKYGRKGDGWFVGSAAALTFSGMCPTSGVSWPCLLAHSLEAHRFADTHSETYAQRCVERGITPHLRMQPKESLGQGERQDMIYTTCSDGCRHVESRWPS